MNKINIQILPIVLAIFVASSIDAQIQVDHRIELTGTGDDARITGIDSVEAPTDAVNVRSLQKGNLIYRQASGSNGNYQVNPEPPLSDIQAGTMIHFKANHANTGATTLDVNGLGEISIYKNVSDELSANDIMENQMVSVIFDGSAFQILSPTGTSGASQPVKRAFISSTEYYGNLGGHSGADATCQTLAQNAGLSGTWIAYISTTGLGAKDKANYTNPIVDMKGNTVSSGGWAGLLGPINGAIKFTEYGNYLEGTAMTGSLTNGTARPGYHCQDFTSSAFGQEVQVGYSSTHTAGWSSQTSWRCWELNRIYCIEN